MFDNFHGNEAAAATLRRMIDEDRIAQTLLLDGPTGIGKATLARRFAQVLLDHPEKIEADDLSLDHNRDVIAEREKWPSEKRSDDPLLFSTHPDFITFCPEGPLRQISIQQMRVLKERAQYKPLKGKWRIFLIDQLDRANIQAADSVLKTLEEPPEHLILFLTAENPYDLPPTIRSRSIAFHLTPLSIDEMEAFVRTRKLEDADRRIALAGGCPGLAVTLDLAVHQKRRALLMAMLEAASGQANFVEWVRQSESFLQSKSEKLDGYFKLLYSLLEDLLTLQSGGYRLLHSDLREPLGKLAGRITFDWLQAAVQQVDEMVSLQRRNVQKGLMVDRFVVTQRSR